MVEKVTFDAANRLIIVNTGITQLDAETDLYSAAKREWKDDIELNKLRLPFRTVAGDPLGQNREVGAYFFLQNQSGADWRIRPDEADHELVILGNLYAEDSEAPMFVPTLGSYTVTISMERSSLTQVLISGSGVTEQDKVDISNKVWDHSVGVEVASDLNTPDQYKADVSALDNPDQFKANISELATTAQLDEHMQLLNDHVSDMNEAVDTIKAHLLHLLQIERGRWEIDEKTCTLTYFDYNGDVLVSFTLQDAEGRPSLEAIRRRVPIALGDHR